jgi:transposase-like protein
MSSTNKEGKPPIYDPGFKVAVAREYLTTHAGYGKLAVKYGLRGPGTVKFFVDWYKRKYPDGIVQQSPAALPASAIRDSQKDKQLQEANLKIAGLEMLIEIAQKELGIDIVKKPGTKQSPK